MTPDALDGLANPYPPGDENREGRFAIALGVLIPDAITLHEELIGDLDPDKLGVGWWAPYPDEARRMLISDHLLQCALSIQINLVEAKLHFLELEDAWRQRSDLFSDSVDMRSGKIFLRRPPVVSPRDELPLKLSALHTAGFFRALGGTLDCLGATIIGVSALPVAILTSDLKRARQAFPSDPGTEGAALQLNLSKTLERAIGSFGPPGWLEWATDFRNMLVHRGRRADIGEFLPEPSPILDSRGRTIIRTRTIQRLPRDPGRSEIEVLLHRANALVLTEQARDTLEGLLDTTIKLLNDVVGELLILWRTRRANPELLAQPREQWLGGPSAESTGFEGYKPGSYDYNPGALIAAPGLITRLRAAALSDQQRYRWERLGT
jgi:hypothetical protein